MVSQIKRKLINYMSQWYRGLHLLGDSSELTEVKKQDVCSQNIRCCANKVGPYLTLMLNNGAKTAISVNIIAKPFNQWDIYSSLEPKIFINTCFGTGSLLVWMIQWIPEYSLPPRNIVTSGRDRQWMSKWVNKYTIIMRLSVSEGPALGAVYEWA